LRGIKSEVDLRGKRIDLMRAGAINPRGQGGAAL